MIVLVHENHDKWTNVTPKSNIFAGVLIMQILEVLSMARNIYQKIT